MQKKIILKKMQIIKGKVDFNYLENCRVNVPQTELHSIIVNRHFDPKYNYVILGSWCDAARRGARGP